MRENAIESIRSHLIKMIARGLPGMCVRACTCADWTLTFKNVDTKFQLFYNFFLLLHSFYRVPVLITDDFSIRHTPSKLSGSLPLAIGSSAAFAGVAPRYCVLKTERMHHFALELRVAVCWLTLGPCVVCHLQLPRFTVIFTRSSYTIWIVQRIPMSLQLPINCE
jgi:hypothetical protein